MRSKLIAMLVTLALTFCICIGTLYFLEKYMDEAENLCSRAVTQVNDDRKSDALETLTILAEKWEHWSNFLESVTSHADLQSVTEQIVDAKTCLEQDDSDSFQRQSRLLDHAIHHILDQEKLRLSNLF